VKQRFFRTQEAFRAWLAKNGAKADELLVGFYKLGSGKGGLTYKQAVDEALCSGWIDGVARGLDDESWAQRYTPRRKGSIWSKINIGHVERLKKAGLMTAAGLASYEKRTDTRSGIYSYENRPQKLDAASERKFRANKKVFFEKQAPSYRRTCVYWVLNAKRAETREKRLAQLIADSANGERVRQFISPPGKGSKAKA